MRSLIVYLILASPVFSQSDRGTLTGTVYDPANALVPNAAVSAKNSATGSEYQTRTTPTGNYTLPQLPVGVYNLTVESAGFSKFIQQGIRVQVAQNVRVDIALQVGSTAESVVVTAEATLLKTENA